MDSKYFIAFDLGATSGRTILGTLTGDKLTLEEVTRFPNQMLQLNGHFYWNIFSLYENLKKGLAAVAQKKVPVTSIGIDTWGVDFAFVNEEGALIELPYAYRDPQTIGKKEEFFEKVMPADELYGVETTEGLRVDTRQSSALHAGCAFLPADWKDGDRIYHCIDFSVAESGNTQIR